MNIKLIIGIAVSLLRARLKQSAIAAIGVTFGIAMFIAMLSFMNGLNSLLDGLMLNRTPHVRLYNDIKPTDQQPVLLSETYKNNTNIIHSIKPKDIGKEIYNSKSIINSIKKDSRVIDLSPKVNAPVFFNSGTIEITGVVNGIDVQSEENLFKVSDYIIAGNVFDLDNESNTIIIGKGLSEKMLVKIGDAIQVTTIKGGLVSLKIVGISQIGIADIDNQMSYTSLATAQMILGESAGYVTDIQVKLHNIALAPEMAKEYKAKFNIDALDAQTANAQFETGSQVRTTISYVVGVTLLIVAGFGIYNILNMMIYEKMDTIAILKATGFSGRDVKWIFISLSLIIGVVGGVMGLVFGFILTNIIGIIPFSTTSLPTIKTYPVVYRISYYIIGITFAMFTTTIAGLLPSLKASRIDPVEIIRGK